MFLFNDRPRTMYDVPDDGGAEAPAEAAPESSEVPPPVPAPADDGGTSDAQPVAEAPDWGARVTEWGGEETIQGALELRQALQTRQGVQDLFIEAAEALGVSVDQARALLTGTPAAPAEPEGESIEDLLSDPDRVLTAAEIQRVLAHDRQTQQRSQSEEQFKATVQSTIATTLSDLKVTDPEDQAIILALADTVLGGNIPEDPAQIASALRTAHGKFQAKVQAEAQGYVQSKHDAHDALPSPLPAGNAGGGEAVPEPTSMAEAKARVRKSLGISLARE